MMVIKGVAASPGIAIGPAYVMEDEEIVINREEISPERVRLELKRFKAALEKTYQDLDAAEAKVLKTLGKEHARLIETHRLILSDPLITKEVPRRIQAEKVNAEFALSEALETVNQAFEKIKDEFFRERRHDLFDVGKRLLSHLLHREKRTLQSPSRPAVLIAHNLLPSDTLALKDTQVIGFATDLGGKTSHTAILAQSMELPAVVGLSDISRRTRGGDIVILDGEQGLVILQPTPEVIARYRQLQEKQELEEKALGSLKGLPAATRDGFRLRLMANYDAPEELKAIHDLKGDGIGLFRTEFLYLNRAAPPNEEEQYKAYAAAAKAVAPNLAVIRTADIGGDRVAELGIEGHQDEQNPFMGLRGVRLFLRYQDLFKTQLRAILRAAEGGNVAILLPMISNLPELMSVKKLITECVNELKREGLVIPKQPELGILVEVPSTALMLDSFLEEVDFISIGTNDLIQYLLAVDRINEHVAHIYDPFHPAVLRVLSQIVETARARGKWASVCGEVASDPRMTPMLIGLGLETLSVSPRMYLRVKQHLRSLNRETCVRLVKQALQLRDSYSIQQLLTSS